MSRTTTRQAAQRAAVSQRRRSRATQTWPQLQEHGPRSQGGISFAAWHAERKGREMIARINEEKRRRWRERAAEKETQR